MNFELGIIGEGKDRRLHFEHIFLSDIHLLTSQCKAKGLCAMLEHGQFDNITMVGDIIDLWHAKKKKDWNMGPWQRQFIGHVLRSDANTTYITGNHDEPFRGSYLASTSLTKQQRSELAKEIKAGLDPFDRTLPIAVKYTDNSRLYNPLLSQFNDRAPIHPYNHRKLVGKSIYGIEFKNHDSYTTKDGQKLLVCHGDGFDEKLRKKHSGTYLIGDSAIEFCYVTEKIVNQLPGVDEFSVVGTLAGTFAGTAEEKTHIKANAAAYAKQHGYDGAIIGHSHIPSIETMPNGSLIINDGSATQHAPQFFAEDKNGVRAILTWRKDGLEISEDGQKKDFVSWDSLGLGHFKAPPQKIEDEYTQKADRVSRLLYRIAAGTKIERERARYRTSAENGGEAIAMKVPIARTYAQASPA